MARTVAEMTPDEFSDAIANSFSRVSGMTGRTGSMPGPGSSAATPTGVPGWVSSVNTGANNLVGAAGKMATGIYGVNDALGNIKDVGGVFGPVGDMVTGMGTKVAEAAINVNGSLNKVAESGVHMGGNLGLYDKAVLSARMSMPEFEQQIKRNSTSLAGLGANMDKSALAYLGVAKQVQETDLAYALKATGTRSEEFGDILSLVANSQKKFDMTNTGVQQRMMATTLALASEFDNTARLTGISRQEQQKSLEKQLKSTDLQLSMATLTQDQQKVLTDNLSSSRKYGETFQNAIRIFSTGGVTTEARQQEVLKLGPLAKYAEQMAALQGTPEQIAKGRQAIEAQMREELVAGTQNTEHLKTMAIHAEAGSETTKAMAQGELERYQLGVIYAKARDEAAKKGMTEEAYIAEETKKIQEERLGALKGTGGPEGESAKLSQTLNKVDIAMKDLTAGAGQYFDGLNKKAGSLITSFGNLDTVLRRYSAEQMANMPKAAAAALKDKTGVHEATIPEKKPGRADGSLGAVGKLIEDFGAGTDMTLHGKEGVITENQLKDLLGSAQSMGKQMSKDISKGDLAAPDKFFEPFKKSFTDIEKIMMTGGPTSQSQFNTIAKHLEKTKTSLPDFEKNFSPMFKNMQVSMEKEFPKIQKQFEPLLGDVKQTTKDIGQSTQAKLSPVLTSMQSGLKADLEKAQKQMPTAQTFEKMFNNVKPQAESTAQPTQDSNQIAGESQSDDSMNDMIKGITELNKRVERLIYAVEDGNNKSVKAIKNTGNLVA